MTDDLPEIRDQLLGPMTMGYGSRAAADTQSLTVSDTIVRIEVVVR